MSKRQHRKSNIETHAPLASGYSVTTYDSELARLAVERNKAYQILHEMEEFGKSLLDGPYQNVAEHMLKILFEET